MNIPTTSHSGKQWEEQPTIGSLFSGYGGLDLAVENVFGARTAWHIENDDAPSKVLAHHWPDVPNFRDVTKVDWSEVEPVDIITGGYPCQPFSRAGHRKGTNDERHLWPHILTAIRSLRPQFAVFENVPGHLGLGFDRVLADLASIGWDAEWTTIRASDVGAPHHRERLFILAYPCGVRPQAQRLPSRPTAEVAWDHDMHSFLAGLNSAADIGHELRLRFGDYGPAILTWALAIGRPPPPLIEDHVTAGAHPAFPEHRAATSPAFVEWLMGLPEGWVTDVPGLSRNQQIKMIGNGVVSQQAEAALLGM